MSGDSPLLPLYSFTEWAATTGHGCFCTVSFHLKCAWPVCDCEMEYPSGEVAAGFRGRCLAIATVRGCFTSWCVSFGGVGDKPRDRHTDTSSSWLFVSCSFGMSKWRAQNGCLYCVINWITIKWLLLLCHQQNNKTHLQSSQMSRIFASKRRYTKISSLINLQLQAVQKFASLQCN